MFYTPIREYRLDYYDGEKYQSVICTDHELNQTLSELINKYGESNVEPIKEIR